MSVLAVGRMGSALSLAHALVSSLNQFFALPFSIWIKQDEWQLLEDWEPSCSQTVRSSTCVAKILEQHELLSETKTLCLCDDQILLIVPMRNECGGQIVVTGQVNGHSADLVRALAEKTLLSLKQGRDLETALNHYDKCIQQITASFEELTWLRSLSEHFEIGDTRNGLLQTARDTLPSLRQLVGAEAIYFFENRPIDRADNLHGYHTSLLFCEGEKLPPEALVCELIEEVEAAGLAQTVVRNAPPCDRVGLRNVLITPILRDGLQMGWIVVVNKFFAANDCESDTEDWDRNLFEFGTVEAGLVETMASMLSTHGRNIDLFREREELVVGVLRALINAIDAKDAYTCGHSDRVAAMSKRIAKELGHSELECEQIHITGLLHDIGKIGVPDNVLGKAGKLTDEEFALIKLHPVIGHDIIKPLERLRFVLPGILHHHESLDGRGYPHGLKGDQIPLDARIIAIADSYDAMTSDRPYRMGMPSAKAEGIIKGGLGTQWDIDVGAAFFAALADIHAICGTGMEPITQSIDSSKSNASP